MQRILLRKNSCGKELSNSVSYCRTLCFSLMAIVMCITSASAQKHIVTGTVYSVDSNGKNPLMGATVTIQNSPTGTSTDANGKYSIQVTSSSDVLEFQFVGYESYSVQVGAQTKIDVELKDASQQINEVVVTALGITRQEKSLGYAVSKLDNEAITATENANWLQGLDGKVAGMNLDTSSSGPGGSVRVTLRGEGSLAHDKNTALFVVDGVPINSAMDGNTSGQSYENDDSPIDFGNGGGDLNPDDIETVSVLKGPAATALYGSRAANGAIIITTKSGKKNKGLGITFSSNVMLEKASYWPDFQTEYGAGNYTLETNLSPDGVTPYEYSMWTITADKTDTGQKIYNTHSRYHFGERFSGQMRYIYSSYNWDTDTYTRKEYKNYDWFKGFFRTGVTYSNSLSVDAGDGKGHSLRVSVKDSRNSWIVPNTGFNTQNISASMSSKKNKYIQAQAKITYYRKNSDNLPLSGYSNATPLKSLMWKYSAVSVDDMWDEYIHGRAWTRAEEGDTTIRLIDANLDNPYAISYEHLNTQSKDRVYGNVSVTGNIIPNELTLTLRSGMDFSTDFRTQQKPYYTIAYSQGMYREQTVRRLEVNTDFLLAYKKSFNNGISFNVSFGGNSMVNKYQSIRLQANMLDAKNVYMLSNVKGNLVTQAVRREKSINSFYGFANFSYKDYFFIDITGRNDWSSTLAPGNNSYFYPSVGVSVLLDEIFHLRQSTNWIQMLKLRGSWANVGNDTDPYQLIDTYAINGSYNNSYQLNGTLKNYGLKPENVESWEIGLEAKLFRGIWNFDVAYYDSATTNQIISVPSDWITGAANTMINAGKVTNKGVEITTTIRPLNRKNLKFTINLNWSKNWNKLVELADGVDLWQVNTNTVGSRVMIYAYPGTELGHVYGVGYERAPEGAFYVDESGKKIDCSGQIIVDPSTGNPKLTEGIKDYGSIYPDWKAGASLSFKWKGLGISASFVGSVGGKAYSLTNAIFSYMGKNKNSLEGRYDGFVVPGVNQNSDGTFSKNAVVVKDVVDSYVNYIWARNNVEQNTFDTSYLKMKELRIEYSLSKKLCQASRVFQGVSFGFFMTNVFCVSKWPQYDPEVSSLAGSSLYRGVETGNYPMTRTYGFNIKLKF